MHTEDAVAGPTFAPEAIKVDVRGLDDFAEFMREELEASLKPTFQRVAVDHNAGVGFGANNASLNMQRARAKYLLCLQRSLDNFMAYIETSVLLVTAVQRAAASYRKADTDATTRSDAVAEAIKDTWQEMEADRARARAAARQELMNQRISHLERENSL